MFEIMFNDLKPEAQKRFLKYMGLKDASEGNYEVVPITMIDYNDEEGYYPDDEDEDADDIICLADEDYVEDSDGCLLVDPRNINTFFDAEIVDIHTVENLDHYKRYRFRADKGPNGELIFEPTGFEYDDEQSQDVSSHEVPCKCDCTECEYAYKCFENGRYDFSDDEEEEGDE